MKTKFLLAIFLQFCLFLTPNAFAQVAPGNYSVTETWTVKIEYSNFGTSHFTGVKNFSGTTTGTVTVDSSSHFLLVSKFGSTTTDTLATTQLGILSLQHRQIAKVGDTYTITGAQVFAETILPDFKGGLAYYGMALLGCFAIHIEMLPSDAPTSAANTQNYSATGPAGVIQGGGTFPNESAKVTVASRVSFGVAPPESVAPTVKISTPVNNYHTTGTSVLLTGTASDNVGVAEVEVSVGAGISKHATLTAGGTAWSVNVDLQPGPNTIQVRAKDGSGNSSTVQSITVHLDSGSIVQVIVHGNGTVTPNLNGSNLIVGKTYSMTAKAGTGFVFGGWVLNTPAGGNVTVSGPALKFTNQTDLIIVANFADGTAPEVAIASPKNNDKVGTDKITVSGTAKDNDAVQRVFVQVNGGAPVQANGTTSWSLSNVQLSPGANTIRVFAEDSRQPNPRSKTNTITVTYLKTAVFQVDVVGPGKIVPNLLGQSLEVGKSYTVTATPNAGSKFVKWDGDILSTSAKLTFVMTEHFIEEVDFSDGTPPTVSVVAPKPNDRIGTANFTASGKASDDGTLTSVRFRLDAGEWLTASGTANWTAALNGLAPGGHTLQVYAVDSATNVSKTVSVPFTYVQMAQFAAAANGPGKIAPNLNGLLEIGKSYTVTATANAGAKFDGWVVEGPSGVTNIATAKLTFNMAAGLHATANFSDGTIPIVKIVTPKPSEKLTSSELVATGTATDNGSVRSVHYRLDGGAWADLAGGTAWTITVPGLTEGNHTLQVYAKDDVGNSSKTNSVAFSYAVVSFKGIYMGTYHSTSGTPESGIVAVMVRSDNTAVFMGGGLDFSLDSSFLHVITVNANGNLIWPEDNEGTVTGKITGATISGNYTNHDNGVSGGGTFTLTLKPDTGIQAANAGYYDNSEFLNEGEDHGGLIAGILAADGTFLFNVGSNHDDDGDNNNDGGGNNNGGGGDDNNDDDGGRGAGKLTISAANKVSGTADVNPVATVTGTLTPATHTINGHYKSLEDEGDFVLTRKYTTAGGLGMSMGLTKPPSQNQHEENSSGVVSTTLSSGSVSGYVSMSMEVRRRSIGEMPPIPLLPLTFVRSELTYPSLSDGITFSFTTQAGHSYSIEVSDDLSTWTSLKTITADSEESTFSEPVSTGAGARFYRVIGQ